MSKTSEFYALQAQIEPADGASPASLLAYLKLARELRIRDSETVAKYGAILLDRHYKALKDDVMTVLEQVAVAAMDCGATTRASRCVQAICKQFPSSIRARKLQGMLLESQGEVERARQQYKAILADHPLNQSILRRMIALEKTNGTTLAAITELNRYLKAFSNDVEGWEEMAELCVEASMFKQAAFCYEELITLAPANLVYFVRYGDVLYTLGGAANLKLARTYYSKGVTLSAGSNARALYGVCACSAQLKTLKGRSDGDPELPALAAEKLVQLYAERCPDKLDVVRDMLQAQELLQ